MNQAVIAGEHEGVDQNPSAFALGYFFQSLSDHQRVQAKGVFVNAAVFQGQRGRFAVGDHDDLAHIFFLARQNTLGEF